MFPDGPTSHRAANQGLPDDQAPRRQSVTSDLNGHHRSPFFPKLRYHASAFCEAVTGASFCELVKLLDPLIFPNRGLSPVRPDGSAATSALLRQRLGTLTTSVTSFSQGSLRMVMGRFPMNQVIGNQWHEQSAICMFTADGYDRHI